MGDGITGRWNEEADFRLGSKPQKGIITFGLAANRQNPFAGAFHDAIFNTWRRFSSQVLYVAPPILVGYYAMNWAIERCEVVLAEDRTQTLTIGRNHYLNSKAGLAEFADSE